MKEHRKKQKIIIISSFYFQIPKVWIENPSEVRVAQWTNISTENGMTQLKFALSPEPNPVKFNTVFSSLYNIMFYWHQSF